MKWGVEFWLRVAIAAGFAAIIIAAPSVLFPFVVSYDPHREHFPDQPYPFSDSEAFSWHF